MPNPSNHLSELRKEVAIEFDKTRQCLPADSDVSKHLKDIKILLAGILGVLGIIGVFILIGVFV